jgi:hypothetical protein
VASRIAEAAAGIVANPIAVNLAERAATEESVAERAAIAVNLAERAATEESVAERAAIEESVAERAAIEESVAEREAIEESVAEREAVRAVIEVELADARGTAIEEVMAGVKVAETTAGVVLTAMARVVDAAMEFAGGMEEGGTMGLDLHVATTGLEVLTAGEEKAMIMATDLVEVGAGTVRVEVMDGMGTATKAATDRNTAGEDPLIGMGLDMLSAMDLISDLGAPMDGTDLAGHMGILLEDPLAG